MLPFRRPKHLADLFLLELKPCPRHFNHRDGIAITTVSASGFVSYFVLRRIQTEDEPTPKHTSEHTSEHVYVTYIFPGVPGRGPVLGGENHQCSQDPKQQDHGSTGTDNC